MRRAPIHLIFIILLGASSCSEDFYAERYSFENAIWKVGEKVPFDFQTKESNRLYDFFVEIETSTDYPYSNMYLFSTFTDSRKKSFTDTILIPIADPTGKWLGEGVFSKKIRVPIKEKVLIKKPSSYTLTFQHGMREKELTGVESIGLIIKQKSTQDDNGK